PILAALVFGKRGGWVLTVITAALGPSLVFALVLALSTLIAGGRTLRMRSKVSTVLLALVPVVVYWAVMSRPPDDLPLALPLRSAVYTPAFFATIFAVAVLAAVVGMGRLSRFNVRLTVLPMVVLMVLGVVAFPVFIGRSELHISALRRDVNFAEYLVGRTRVPRLSAEMRDRLNRFMDEYPRARRADEAAYVLPRDTELAGRWADGKLRDDLRDDVLGMWEKIVREYPESRYAMDARLALSRISASEGNLDDARSYYASIISRCSAMVPSPADPISDFSVFGGLWSIGRRLDAHDLSKRNAENCARARRELAFIRENSGCTLCGGKALRYFVRAGALAGSVVHPGSLERVLEFCPSGKVVDNVAYELARLKDDASERRAALADLVEKYPGTDGALLGLYDLSDVDTSKEQPPDVISSAIERLREMQVLLEARREKDADDLYVEILVPLVKNRLLHLEAG
ncbi:MAG: hypothetical protein QGD94_11965, partial [Planctomycetia bacterium]|nr:hypothetical protein [Planctomycetia bacterium]